MSLKRDWKVEKSTRIVVEPFIEKWHYSGSINGCIADYCYVLRHGEEIKGALFYGRMAMANQWKKFSDSPDSVIELRRLCCVDDTPKNTESYFIGRSLRLLKEDWGGRKVVSYADKEYNHVGTVYRASNFEMVGEIPGAKVIVYGGRRYHDKAIRTKYKGKIKPFAERLIHALNTGDAYYHKTKGKYTYVYVYR